MKYEKITPFSNYAPWRNDSEFLECYRQIESSTLVDMYRCHSLWSLLEQASKLSRGAMMEIGVWRGGTGALLAKKAKMCGIVEKLYLCDTFTGVPKASCFDPHYRGGEHADTSLEMVRELFGKLQLANVQILSGIFPEETAVLVDAPSFRFCHIDVDVYDSAKGCVDWIWDRLVVGGMIVFDDYGFSGCGGVTKYVDEFKEFKNLHFIHNLNGHAIMIKLA